MLVLGSNASLAGMATRLERIHAKSPRLVEKDLGYREGRLAQGYWIGVLNAPLRASDVEFAGLTLRSGGRDGLPLADASADRGRKRVYDRMVEEYGQQHVDAMRKRLAADTGNLLGPTRIVKFVPVERSVSTDAALEYPMGEGSAQYLLTKAHNFLIVVEVGVDRVARTAAGWSVSVDDNAPYDGRARLARYLESVR